VVGLAVGGIWGVGGGCCGVELTGSGVGSLWVCGVVVGWGGRVLRAAVIAVRGGWWAVHLAGFIAGRA